MTIFNVYLIQVNLHQVYVFTVRKIRLFSCPILIGINNSDNVQYTVGAIQHFRKRMTSGKTLCLYEHTHDFLLSIEFEGPQKKRGS